MPFTGRLGTENSQLGLIELGFADANNLEQFVNQTLDFVQSAEFGEEIEEEVEQSLSLVQVVAVQHCIFVNVSQTLAFVQDADQNFKFGIASDTLAFVQTVGLQGPIYLTVHQTLHLEQDADDPHKFVKVEQVLGFVQSAGRTIPVSVSQTLAFTQNGERKNIVLQTLALLQSVAVGKGGDVEQELGLTEVITVRGIFRRLPTDDLGLNQSATYYIDRGCVRVAYSPYVGASDPDYTPPTTVEPTLGSNTLTLTHPYTAPTTTLVLRNPAFSDKDRLNFNRINRETRGGTLIVFSDPKWPKTQTLALQVDNLNPTQAEDMIVFLRTSLGQEIGLLDWENRQWRGIITTPDARITHVGRHDRSIAFEFQGRLA